MPAEYLLPWRQRPQIANLASGLRLLLCSADSLALSISRTTALPFRTKEVFGQPMVAWSGCGNRLKDWAAIDARLTSELIKHHTLSPAAQLLLDAAAQRADQRGFSAFHASHIPVREKVDALNGFFTELKTMLAKERFRSRRDSHRKDAEQHYQDLASFFERVVAHHPRSFVLRFELSYVNLRNAQVTAPGVDSRLIKDHMRLIEKKVRALLGTALVAFVAKQEHNAWEGHRLHWLLVADEMAAHEVRYARDALCDFWVDELAGPTAAFHGFQPGSDLLGNYRGFGTGSTLEAVGAQLQRAAMYLAGTDAMMSFQPAGSRASSKLNVWARASVGPVTVESGGPWAASSPVTTLL